MSLFKDLITYGKLPTIETDVSIEKDSINRTALMLFLASFLIILSYFILKKSV